MTYRLSLREPNTEGVWWFRAPYWACRSDRLFKPPQPPGRCGGFETGFSSRLNHRDVWGGFETGFSSRLNHRDVWVVSTVAPTALLNHRNLAQPW